MADDPVNCPAQQLVQHSWICLRSDTRQYLQHALGQTKFRQILLHLSEVRKEPRLENSDHSEPLQQHMERGNSCSTAGSASGVGQHHVHVSLCRSCPSSNGVVLIAAKN